MKIIKKFQLFKENIGEDLTEYELKIKNEYSMLKKGHSKGYIDLGKVNNVSKIDIDNIKKTYPNEEVILKDGRYLLTVNEAKMDMYGKPENYKTTLSDFGDEVNWFVVDKVEGPLSGWEYLGDAFDDLIERYINEMEGEYDELEDIRIDIRDKIEDFMGVYGFGEPEDDDDYDTDEIDEFLEEELPEISKSNLVIRYRSEM